MALSQEMTRDVDTSFSRPEGGSNNQERVPLAKIGGKPETWADFRSGLKAILGTCKPAIVMVRLRYAMPEAATGSSWVLPSRRRRGLCSTGSTATVR